MMKITEIKKVKSMRVGDFGVTNQRIAGEESVVRLVSLGVSNYALIDEYGNPFRVASSWDAMELIIGSLIHKVYRMENVELILKEE